MNTTAEHPAAIRTEGAANDGQTGAEGIAAPARTPATDAPSKHTSNRGDATTSPERAAMLALHAGDAFDGPAVAPFRALLVETMGAVLSHQPPAFGRRSKDELIHILYAAMTDTAQDEEHGLHIMEGCAAALAGACASAASDEYRRVAEGKARGRDHAAGLWSGLAGRFGGLLSPDDDGEEGEGAVGA